MTANDYEYTFYKQLNIEIMWCGRERERERAQAYCIKTELAIK